MPSSGKFKVRVAKIIRETTSSKFDGPNTIVFPKINDKGIIKYLYPFRGMVRIKKN